MRNKITCIKDLDNDFLKGNKYILETYSDEEIYVESEDGSCVSFEKEEFDEYFLM